MENFHISLQIRAIARLIYSKKNLTPENHITKYLTLRSIYNSSQNLHIVGDRYKKELRLFQPKQWVNSLESILPSLMNFSLYRAKERSF